ncbi:hypothetical protein F5Y18DRAFT_425821 [Xylariaceae sp. FL1019]|nr:hypothetical protein F5Y18DRAFT_425821 [Xylariaceae sp. FL1019]
MSCFNNLPDIGTANEEIRYVFDQYGQERVFNLHSKEKRWEVICQRLAPFFLTTGDHSLGRAQLRASEAFGFMRKSQSYQEFTHHWIGKDWDLPLATYNQTIRLLEDPTVTGSLSTEALELHNDRYSVENANFFAARFLTRILIDYRATQFPFPRTEPTGSKDLSNSDVRWMFFFALMYEQLHIMHLNEIKVKGGPLLQWRISHTDSRAHRKDEPDEATSLVTRDFLDAK